MTGHVIPRPRVLVAAAMLAAPAPGAAATQAAPQQGAFSISRDGGVVGREEYQVRRGPGAGVTVSSTASYPPTQPIRTISVTLELTADRNPLSAELHERGEARRSAVVRFAARRITIRTLTATGESVREYPRRGAVLPVAAGAFAPFLALEAAAPGPVIVLAPLSDTRGQGRLAEHGVERVRVKGVERSLRRRTLAWDGEERHLWFDEAGRLVQIADPARGIRAVRDDG